MSEKEWYQALLEDNCSMVVDIEGNSSYSMCSVERTISETDWEKSRRRARQPGLGPDNISFLFKMMTQKVSEITATIYLMIWMYEPSLMRS